MFVLSLRNTLLFLYKENDDVSSSVQYYLTFSTTSILWMRKGTMRTVSVPPPRD
ncbi:hypothetical protein C8C83_3447 [Flavobacterium sp. 90]|uniref:hypothetical protein n=1 Tax=Flavobacterium sp. 81 TaxID=2135621 RepID=UPI000F1286CB|nr:hypothetical protein [Flavobacterium sp. 81]RKR11704.1 hypothetical protein C8C82_3765 [Flavobacterium sp. 81]TCK55479.1 hypothetical protein C8C83_3447 [Flavobacterium sp. 90]